MDEERLEYLLTDILTEIADWDDEDREQAGLTCAAPLRIGNVESFEQAGILTSNRGLVLRLADGSEFQITIVQAQKAHTR